MIPKLHLFASTNGLRPNLCYVHVIDNALIVTDASILVKYDARLVFDEDLLPKLNGYSFTREQFELFTFFDTKKPFISFENETLYYQHKKFGQIGFKLVKLKNQPDYNQVIKSAVELAKSTEQEGKQYKFYSKYYYIVGRVFSGQLINWIYSRRNNGALFYNEEKEFYGMLMPSNMESLNDISFNF